MGSLPLGDVGDAGERAGWTLVWLAVVGSGLSEWGQWTQWPAMAALAPLVVLVGLVGLAATWAASDPRRVARAGLVAAFSSAALASGVDIAARSYYTTDSAAFTHVATQVLLRGVDPYRVRLRGATALLHPAGQYWTYLVDGGHVIRVSYPAGAIVLQAPLMWLGLTHLTTDWVDLVAWLAAAALLGAALPRSTRWLAGVLVLSGSYLGTFANGGTDALFIPFVMVALWRWDRAGDPAARRWWIAPAALGLACSIKQSPWFLVPFLLLAIALEARARGWSPARATLRYGAVVAGTFALPNLPFLIWDPRAWWHGTLLPLTSPLVPDGQGLVSLALHGVTGGAVITDLWVAAALVTLALLLATALYYRALKRVWPFLVALALFVPGRSLSNYLIDFVPAAIVAAISVAEAPRLPTTRRRALYVAAPLVGAALTAVVGLTSAPLAIAIEHVASVDRHQALTAVTVTVTNRTGATIEPHLWVSIDGGHPTGFWRASATSGALPLAPHASATLTLTPPAWFWAPPDRGYLVVEADTASPAAVSTSAPRRWDYPLPSPASG
jgi:uncharacterized membrane protein